MTVRRVVMRSVVEDMPENTTELNTKEREIISTYRKYSRSKKEMLGTYMKMLEQFEEI